MFQFTALSYEVRVYYCNLVLKRHILPKGVIEKKFLDSIGAIYLMFLGRYNI